jgi:hypothetical protein
VGSGPPFAPRLPDKRNNNLSPNDGGVSHISTEPPSTMGSVEKVAGGSIPCNAPHGVSASPVKGLCDLCLGLEKVCIPPQCHNLRHLANTSNILHWPCLHPLPFVSTSRRFLVTSTMMALTNSGMRQHCHQWTTQLWFLSLPSTFLALMPRRSFSASSIFESLCDHPYF